jgi:Tol biopolymer transport system component
MKRNLILTLGLMTVWIISGGASRQQSIADIFQQAVHLEEVKGDLQAAIPLYQKVVLESNDRSLAARAQLRIGLCYEKLGNSEARKAYQEVLNKFSDQSDVTEEARARLAALEKPVAEGNRGRLTVRQVWGHGGGSVSPDGRYITFVQNLDLAVHDLVTDKDTLLTSFGSLEARKLVEYSIFSPDGRQIAYDRHNGDETWDLCVIGLDGSGSRVLVHRENNDWICPAAWSPDGKRILTAFFRKESSGLTGEIAFVSVSDGSIQIIKTTHETTASNFTQMSISPDGRYIAYPAPAEKGSSQKDIFLLSTNGKQDFPLVQHPADDSSPSWTPDGDKILFVSDRGGTPGFWMANVEDGKSQGTPSLVKADIGQFGGRIGFTRQGSYFYELSTTRQDVYTADLDPATGEIQGETRILASRILGSNSEPAWSPDGQYLAYYRQRGQDSYAAGALTVVIRSVQTGNERELSTNLLPYGCIRWFPDGQSLLVSALRAPKDFRVDYYRVDVQTGEVTQMLQRESGAGTFWPGLSRDGKTIFFTVYRHAGSDDGFLLSYQIENRQEKELYRIGPGRRVRQGVVVSPDGRQLAFVDQEPPYPFPSVVKIVPAEGGQAKELLRIPWPGYIDGHSMLAWAPDGRHLFVIKGSMPGVMGELLRIPVAGGEPQESGLTARRLASPSINPDGNRIAYSALSQSPANEIWVMENFLSPKK